MKTKISQIFVYLSLTLAGLLIGLGIGHQLGCSAMVKTIKDYNHSLDTTRDINYEHYCDSIWITNPDYYLDVLVETDEFQSYIEKHGEWWDK
jgi:hypothetical protein